VVFDGVKKPSDASPSESDAKKKGIAGLQWDLRNVIMNGYSAAVPPFYEPTGDSDLDRSKIDFRVAIELFKQGFDESEIKATFMNPEYGISEKALEEEKRGNLENYLVKQTLKKARQKAETELMRFPEIGEMLVIESPEKLDKAPPIRFAVQGILPIGGMAVVSGASKAGKSLLTTDLMLLMAGGEGKFLERFPINVPGKVIYCQSEVTRPSLRYRLDKIAGSRENDWKKLPLGFFNGSFDLGNSRHVQARINSHKKEKADYLIIDPLARFHRGNENRQNDMATVLSAVDRAAREAELLGSILVHHHGKPASDGNAREGVHMMRGASIIGDWGNAHILLKKRFSGGTGKKFVTVEFELRDAEEPAPIHLAMDKESLRFVDFSIEEEKVGIVLGIVDATREESSKVQVKEIMNRMNCTKQEAERLLAASKRNEMHGAGGGNGSGNGGNGHSKPADTKSVIRSVGPLKS
jgi:hypothetical protein